MVLVVLILFLLFVFSLTVFTVSSFVAFLMTRVPFVTTNNNDIKFIVEKLGIKSSDIFYDLGSGNGKVVFLVEKLSGAKVKGFELGLWTIVYSKAKALFIGSKAKFVNRNFFKQDWSEAGFIYCYLFPPLMARVEEKFKSEMKPGSVAIIRDFSLPTLEYSQKYIMPKGHVVYIYKL